MITQLKILAFLPVMLVCIVLAFLLYSGLKLRDKLEEMAGLT